MRVITDISQSLSALTPAWPGDPAVSVTRNAAPGGSSVSQIVFSSHSGTHVDPPAHYLPDGATADQLPLEAMVGPAWVAQAPGDGHITALALAQLGIPENVTRLLLRTKNSDTPREAAGFDPDFVALAPDAAQWLLGRGVQLIGIDGPSIDPFTAAEDAPVHRTLLGAGVVIVEGLVLRDAETGPCSLICLPLKLKDGDGAPARAVLVYDQVESKGSSYA